MTTIYQDFDFNTLTKEDLIQRHIQALERSDNFYAPIFAKVAVKALGASGPIILNKELLELMIKSLE